MQMELPFALVNGAQLSQIPHDLYIPPDALEVFLEAFEGPLDLLLYLIRKQNMDILDICIADITRQYMGYIEVMNELRLELAAEYLVMAAMLAEIKSRMLLPRPAEEQQQEEDPRAELIRRLQEYERYKRAAENIDGLDQLGRDLFMTHIGSEVCQPEKILPQVTLQEMLAALADVLKRVEHFSHHEIRREALSVREKMSRILFRLREDGAIPFSELLDPSEGRRGVVVSFLALLELTRESLITLTQCSAFAPIYAQVNTV